MPCNLAVANDVAWGDLCVKVLLWIALGGLLLVGPDAVRATTLVRTPQAIAERIDDWRRENALAGVELTIRHGSRTVIDTAFGHANAGEAVRIQSLSKAITAACIATLIDHGKLSFSTTLGQALPTFFTAYGGAEDKRIREITMEELLTHRSGLAGNDDVRPIFRKGLGNYLRDHAASSSDVSALLAGFLRAPLRRPPGETFAYSNIGYLALGVVIGEVSGQSYETYCREAVLEPLGIKSGRLSPGWRILSGAGGWEMSGPDYLAFYDALADGIAPVSAASLAWAKAQAIHRLPSDKGAWYGLGTRVKSAAGGRLMIYHDGSWRYAQADAKDGPLQANEGSYAVRLPDGTGIFVSWWPNPDDVVISLEKALSAGYRAVESW